MSNQFQSGGFVPSTEFNDAADFQEFEESRTVEREGRNDFYTREWRVNLAVSVNWDIINPARVPEIAAARDQFERARDAYLIALRDLRLDASTSYFTLQAADERVRVGQASVRASLLSLRDARARYNAGVNTKLDVLEAETQLAQDRKVLTDALAFQDISAQDCPVACLPKTSATAAP